MKNLFAPSGPTGNAILFDGSGLTGLGLMIVGLALGSAFGWTVVPLVVVGLGLVGVLAWILTHRQTVAGFFGLRSTQSSANILVSVIAVVLILVVVNFLSTRYVAKFDLTAEGFYSLSPQTTKIVKDLKETVKISSFAITPNSTVRQQLERYQQLNPEKIQFEVINPRRSPEAARQLEVTQDNSLVVQVGTRKQVIAQVSPVELESKLTPAILKVTSNRELNAYFVQGHGEVPLSGSGSLEKAVGSLAEEGYRTKPLNLVESDIPADASVVVVAGSQRALFAQEVERLKSYLDKGGRVFLLLSPQLKRDSSDPVYGLGSLLEAWGVQADNNVVVDVSEVGQMLGTGPSVALVTTYGSHPITTEIARQGLMTFFPLARSLSATTKESIKATPFLSTSVRSWGEVDPPQDNSQSLKFDPNKDKQGPLELGIALTKTLPAADATAKPTEARLVVIGNTSFGIDTNFAQQGNGDLFLNSVNWLADQGDLISIRAKSPTNRRFSLTAQNLTGLVVLAVFLLPIVALGSGIYLWWSRR